MACGGDDCDDLNPLVFAGAAETCGDGIDNDCNDVADDKDGDEDGHVDAACVDYRGPLPADDCDDARRAANPDRDEVCGDGVDNDCDGSVDNRDADGDHFIDVACDGTDCDDGDDTVGPGRLEVCDGQDNDCNETVDDKDLDADGHVDARCDAYPGPLPIDDCDDANVGVNPDMDEVCGNRADEDCSGAVDDKDVDRDGVVDDDPVCGGNDCDDHDPLVFPQAPEVRDGKDNDCDPDGRPDEGLLPAGAVVVTEILYDASETPDENYEWFEVFNPGDRPVNLRTWLIHDALGPAQEIAQVNLDVVVPPRGFAVLCRTASPDLNGGVNCAYEYGFFQLANTADELILEFGRRRIEVLSYDEGAGWPAASSGSLNLDPDAFGFDNNDPQRWCDHPPGRSIGNGDEGTPGRSNVSCTRPVNAPQVTAVHPDNVAAAGGAELRLVGAGFEDVTGVEVGGVACGAVQIVSDGEIRCTAPAGDPGPIAVRVLEGPQSDQLLGLTYTREAGGEARLAAASLEGPAVAAFLRGTWSEGLFAQVREPGLTGGGCPAGREYPRDTLLAEVGYGAPGSDPRTHGSWIWFPGWCERPRGDADEFKGAVRIETPGTFSYGWRFSTDGGLSWTYADDDGAANGLQADRLGTLVVR